jgi:hypothetical protein
MHNILLESLILEFSWKESRLECLVGMIISLIEHCSVSGKNMALGLKGEVNHNSKTQRIYRFFRDQIFNYDQVAKFILNILPMINILLLLIELAGNLGKAI